MSKKQLLRAGCFAAAVAVMLCLITHLLRDKETTLASFYSEPDNTVEAIIVGSSHVNATYVPGILWREYGISAHNVFSWSQPMWISYHYIIEALKTQTPKVAVLEMYGMMYGHSYIMPQEIDGTSYKNSFNIDPGLNFLAMTGTVAKCGIDLRSPIEFLNLVRYHARWKYLDAETLSYNAHRRQSYLKGYGFMLNQVGQGAALLPYGHITRQKQPYETALLYLDKIVSLCEKRGIELVFTLSPYRYNEVEIELYNYLSAYAKERGIPFLNYCTDLREACGFNFETDMADDGHTNYWGAEKITRHLGEYLSGTVSFTPVKQMSNAAQQDSDADKMYRTVEAAQLLLETDTAAFLSGLDDGAELLLVADSRAVNFSGDAAKALRALGIEGLNRILDGEAGYCAGVYTAGGQSGPFSAGEVSAAHREMTAGAGPKGLWIEAGGVRYSSPGAGMAWLYYDNILERPLAFGYITQDDAQTMVLNEIVT